jgi:CDP-4-dehydro-6-deoxyglucose reductase, E3
MDTTWRTNKRTAAAAASSGFPARATQVAPADACGTVATRLAARAQVTPDVVELWFDVIEPVPLRFRGGQYVTMMLGLDGEGQPVRRSFSVASLSDGGSRLRFFIRMPKGAPLFELFSALPLGFEVPMTAPSGALVLAPHHGGDVVFAATGTGLAPVLAMLGELQGRQESGRRFVYWGLREESDIFIRSEVERACGAAGALLRVFLSRASGRWTGRRGRITHALVDETPQLIQPTFYLVGNPAMVAATKTALVAVGIDRRSQIVTEAYFD